MNDSQACCGTKFRPVGGARQPVQVLSQECVHSGSRVHDGVRKHHRAMAYAVAGLNAGFQVLEDLYKACFHSLCLVLPFSRPYPYAGFLVATPCPQVNEVCYEPVAFLLHCAGLGVLLVLQSTPAWSGRNCRYRAGTCKSAWLWLCKNSR